MNRPSAEGANLEITEHPQFEKRWRRIQSVFFTFFALLVICALLGIFGSGPLAHGRSVVPVGAITLEYQRFARARTPETMILRLGGADRPDATAPLELRVDRALAERIAIQRISPAPVASVVGGGGVRYVFARGPGAGDIRIEAKPDRPGLATGDLHVDGRRVALSQIVWP
jgi:hypothetical protein